MKYKCLLNFYYLCNDFMFFPKKSFFYKLLWRIYIFFNIKKYINIIFVNKKDMFLVNKKFRNKNVVTDVLSFSFLNINKIYKINFLGDILFCPFKIFIKSNFIKYNYLKYFSILTIHSVLHLLGFKHKKIKDFNIMNMLENFFYLKYKKLI